MSKTDEATANLVEGENNKEKLKEGKSPVDTSEPLIRKMDAKARHLQPDIKTSILKNLGEYKSDLKKLKNQAKKIIKGKSDKGVTNEELMEAGLLGDNIEDVCENPKTGTTTPTPPPVNDTITVDHHQNGKNPKAEPVINVTEKTQKADTSDIVNRKNPKTDPVISTVTKETQKAETADIANRKNPKTDPVISTVTKETQKAETTGIANGKNPKTDPVISTVTKETHKAETTDVVNGNRKEDTVNVSGNDQKAHTVIVLNANREADNVIVLSANQEADIVHVTAGNQKATAAAAADTMILKGHEEAEDPNISGHRKESSDKKKGIEISPEDIKKAREKIRKGKKVVADTKDIKQALLKDYHQHHGSLHQAKEIIHGVNDSVDMARRILSFIQSKMHYCKCLVITIAACIIFATLVLLYFKVVRQH